LLCGCAAGAARDPNTLVVLEAADGATLNPLFTTDAASALYEQFIFDPLVYVGDDFKPIPWLATSWRSTSDHLHWTVDLRHDVRWSDGAPFTAQDVAWTWQAQLDPATGFPYRGQFDYVKDVKAEGPYRVEFTLSQPNALFESQALNANILPEHILGSIAHKQLRVSTFGEHPVGTGPFFLERWRHDEQISFVRNPHWWHGPVTIPRIAVRIELNDQARLDAMEDGSGDVLDGLGTSSYSILAEEAPRLHLLHLPDLYNFFVYTNLRRPGLAELPVRQAMLYGWDRAAVVHGLLHDDAIVATGVVPVALRLWYDPKVRRYGYDPVRASALLDGAGWKPGRGGIREKDGHRLAYELLLEGADAATQDLAAEFQSDMRAIGVAITVRSLDFATFLAETQELRYDLALAGWGGVADPDQFTLLESKQVPPTGNNLMSYSNPIVDRDVTLGLRTLDYPKRRALYDSMQRVTAQDLPVLFYINSYYRAAFNPRVHLSVKQILPDQYVFRDIYAWRLDR
jgi:peptide/nickel transport system substrate-binding protein